MPLAKRLAPHLQRLVVKRLSGGEVAFGVQQHAEVVDGCERAWMPITKRLALHLQRLTVQRLGGGKVALAMQQRAEVVGAVERV